MIIIQKKRIQIIILCLIISILSFTLQIGKEDVNLESKEENYLRETTATPVSGKTIIVDAGHGTPDERSRK